MTDFDVPMFNWAWSMWEGRPRRICGQCAANLIEVGAVSPELHEVDGLFRLVLVPRKGLTPAQVREASGHGRTHN